MTPRAGTALDMMTRDQAELELSVIAAYILKRPYMAASSSSAPLKKSKDSSEEDEEKSALELLLDDGNFDLLRALLAALAPREAARLSQISRQRVGPPRMPSR